MVGGVHSPTDIKLMDWQASLAQQHYQATGQLTVGVQDNDPIHRSQLVQQRWDDWADQGLPILFLPPYSPQLNTIETEWHQFKTHELAGRQFDDELDLVDAIIAGIQARALIHGRSLECFLFN